jgi:hypothetical protein
VVPTWQSGKWISLVAPNSQLLLLPWGQANHCWLILDAWLPGQLRQKFSGVLYMPTVLKPLLAISPVGGVESNRELSGKA